MKERAGWKWKQIGDDEESGYWIKIQEKGRHGHKLPFFCPYEKCGRPTGEIDNKFLLEYGCCRLCYTMYIDTRKVSLIDVEYYKKRLQKRGY